MRRGHEVFGHGYRWEEYFKMDREAEREAIRKAVEFHHPDHGTASVGMVHPVRAER